MEIRDGFIVSIFNYCDRWCEACSLTSRCRVFADMAEHDAQRDPSHADLIQAPPLESERPESPPQWLQERIEEANAIAAQDADHLEPRPTRPEHRLLEARATAYSRLAFHWLQSQPDGWSAADPGDPVAIVGHFSHFVAATVHRATFGIANVDADDDPPHDHDGSAKAALLGVERSQSAWRTLAEAGRISGDTAAPLLAALEWLEREIERVFPNCRRFVRPGFDEPEAVSRLEAESGR